MKKGILIAAIFTFIIWAGYKDARYEYNKFITWKNGASYCTCEKGAKA